MTMNVQIREPCGVLIVNKHKGVTSHDIVNQIRHLYGTRRVGHTGTLDPLATGVLVVLIGRAAKASEYLVCDRKKYRAVLRLGLTTDTEDVTGKILTKTEQIPCPDEVFRVCSEFRGEILQIPPMYSALKVGGQKLVDLAREGKTVTREPRQVTIHSIKCIKGDNNFDYTLDVDCSSGTYIRTLCADIGQKLGCGAVMAELTRLESGGFSLDNGYTVEELKEKKSEELPDLLIPVESLFASLSEVRLPAFYEKLCRSGCEIYQKKIGTDYLIGERVRICDESGAFFALGELREYPDGSAVKSIKTFDLG